MRQLTVLLTMVLLLGCGDALLGPGESVDDLTGSSPEEAAERSLPVFLGLVTAADFASLGFETLEEVSEARLGDPLPVRAAGLDRLTVYRGEEDPESVFAEPSRVVFPVVVGDEVRTSLEVQRINDHWQGSSIGLPALARLIAEHRVNDHDTLVSVLALNVYALARTTGDQILITPIFDYPEADLAAGRELPGAQFLEQLVPLAQEADEDVPR